MNTIQVLGTGRLRILPGPTTLDAAVTVSLERPNGHRLTLSRVPAGKRALLVAVITDGASDLAARPHCASAAATGFALGAGVVWANQPAPNIGPADQVGLLADPGTPGWQRALLDRLNGRSVQFEVHPAGCGCGRSVPIPRQRAASGQEALR
jgi:hypothetical protein